MELIYPLVIFIGVPIIALLVFIKLKKPMSYDKGKKIANTKYVEKIEYYKEAMKKYKMLSISTKVVCVVAILMSLVLLSRPAKIDTTSSVAYNRDIFLCMDVSMSVDELNQKLVGTLKETVKSLNGERFGISIFNTSSVLLVPLTDDYDYILSVLDNLEESFKANIDMDFSNDSMYIRDYIQSGTLVGNEERGSSLIGDGLASCIYNFSNLEEDRSRVVIFSTDNDLAGKEIITLQEASQLAKSKNVTVFGIAPDTISAEKESQFKQAVELTGGNYYTDTSSTTVKDIVNEIEKKGKSLIKGQKQVTKIDIPQVPFIILLISLMALFILNKKVNL